MKSAEALSEFLECNSIKGFLALNEAQRLMNLAKHACVLGPALEIGSYCGKSSVFLGEACKSSGALLYCVDHHRGSEEHQLGEQYHDNELFDEAANRIDTLPSLRRTLFLSGLEETAVPIVTSSKLALTHWATPLGMVFVDGGHSLDAAMFDCLEWSRHIMTGGILAVHDLFEQPEDGGQAPFIAFNAVFEQGGWEKLEQVGSMGALRKLA